jgi:hypothetical protein
MRTLKSLLIIASFLLTQSAFSQEFTVPEVELNVKEDYAKVEKDVIAGTKWLLSVPLNEQAAKRKEVYAFLVKWISGSPTVTVEVYSAILDLDKKNRGMMIMFMACCAKYVLENNYSTDVRAMQKAAFRDLIAYYKAGNGTQKDKKMDKLVKADEEGKLDEWIQKNLK